MKQDFSSYISTDYNKDYRTPIKNLFEDENNLKYSFDFIHFPRECIKYVQRQGSKYHEGLYQLLSAYERFFVNNRLKDRYLKVYYQIYYCFYCLFRSWGDCLSDDYKTWIQKKWLSICVNSVSDPDIEYSFQNRQIDPNKSIDAEIEIQDILFDDAGKLKKEFDKPEREPYLESVLDWSLRRYNLAIATKLVRILCLKPNQPRGLWKTLKVIFPKKLGNWLILTMAIVLLTVLGSNHFWDAINALANAYGSVRVNLSAINFFTTVLVVLYPLILIFFFASFWRKTFLVFKLLLPRMVGGIIVGYLPLILTGEAWDMVKEMNELEAFCLVAFALSFSFYYIFIEVNNTVKNKWVSFGRALRVFSTGLLESFLIGIVVSDVITRAFYPSLVKNSYTVPGLFGHIYPRLLYLYFPLSLLIGLFVQIIWEEKPITHPL